MKKLRYFFEYLLLRLLTLLFFVLGVDKASAFGGWLGRMIGPRLGATRKAKRHMRLALAELSEEQINAYVLGMWDNLGRVIAEYPHLEKIMRERVETNALDIVEAAAANGKGIILFSGHIGNWEVAPAYVNNHFDIPVSVLYRAPNNPFADALLTRYRTLNGKLAALPKSQSGGVAALKALRRNEIMGILIDQKYNEGVSVPFFGAPAMTNPIFVKMAQKFDAPLLPFRIIRTGGAYFGMEFYPPIETTGREEIDVINDAHRYLESWIRENPAQWLWLHRRWPANSFD